MLDDALRRRIETLNRGPLPARVAAQPMAAAEDSAAIPADICRPNYSVNPPTGKFPPRSSPAPQTIPKTWSGQALRPLPGLLRRGQLVESAGRQHLRIAIEIGELWPGGDRLTAARCEHLRQAAATSPPPAEPKAARSTDLAAFVAALPDRTLVLDLETCGLAGAALFLVGLLRNIAGRPTIELLFARNYAEEPAILQSLWQLLTGYDVLVTFNGKAFDWPLVCERSVRHRLAGTYSTQTLQHVDVLKHARRRWRRQLPDCRLQTLERHVCRRQRSGDIPGHLIPAAYADFVRTGFERDLEAVLYHCALDLLTSFDLALRLAG